MNQARIATSTLFFCGGLTTSVWAARIPAIQHNLGLSDAKLGLILLSAPVGILVALSFAGRLVDRFGGAIASRPAYLGMIALFVPAGYAHSTWILVTSLFLSFGLFGGIGDVSINATALAVEQQSGRTLMSSFQALFSFGEMAGSLLGTASAALHLSPAFIFTIVAAPQLVVVAVALAALPPDRPTVPAARQPATAPAARRRVALRWPSAFNGLLLLGAVALFCQLGEGATRDWSGVFLQTSRGASPGLAAAGYASFSIAMAVGRLFGDRLRASFGSRRTIRWSAAIAGAGLAFSAAVPQAGLSALGFALSGLGLSCIAPLVMAAAGNSRATSTGQSIAFVAGIGYAGSLLGPPLIGNLAQGIGLGAALGVAAALIGLITLLTRSIPEAASVVPVRDAVGDASAAPSA